MRSSNMEGIPQKTESQDGGFAGAKHGDIRLIRENAEHRREKGHGAPHREKNFKKSCQNRLTGLGEVRNILPRAARECGAAEAPPGRRRDLENRILRKTEFFEEMRCVIEVADRRRWIAPRPGGPTERDAMSGAVPNQAFRGGQRCPPHIRTESLILAQDERWRRA